jgi:hypothetical protein
VNDDELGEALYRLHRLELGWEPQGIRDRELLQLCRDVVRDHLLDDTVDFRMWISRLIRDTLLSDAALSRGHGVDEVAEFWVWFDRALFTSREDVPGPQAQLPA